MFWFKLLLSKFVQPPFALYKLPSTNRLQKILGQWWAVTRKKGRPVVWRLGVSSSFSLTAVRHPTATIESGRNAQHNDIIQTPTWNPMMRRASTILGRTPKMPPVQELPGSTTCFLSVTFENTMASACFLACFMHSAPGASRSHIYSVKIVRAICASPEFGSSRLGEVLREGACTLAFQVVRHAGVETTKGGLLIAEPSSTHSLHHILASLLPFTPGSPWGTV